MNSNLLEKISFLNLPTKIIFGKDLKSGKSLYYSVNKRCFGDFRSLFKNRSSLLQNVKHILKLKRTKYSASNSCLVIKSLNGGIILDLHSRKVIKFLCSNLEPSFLTNELMAQQLLPLNYPTIHHYCEHKGYNVLVSELVESNLKLDWNNWTLYSEKIFSLMLSFSMQGTIKEKSTNEFFDSFFNKSKLLIRDSLFLNEELDEILKLTKQLHSKIYWNITYPTKFSHGDLTINNVFITEEGPVLFDWANGGVLHLYYDLMIQHFYDPNHECWSRFFQINFFDENSEKFYFNKALIPYTRLLSNQDYLTDALLKQGLIISVCEATLKNFERYQSKDEFRDGKIILRNVISILMNILKSDATETNLL